MSWRIEATNLSGASQGVIEGADARKVMRRLNGSASIAGTLPLDNDAADFLLQGDAYLKAYEGNILRAHVPLITAEEVAGATTSGGALGSVAFAGFDPLWRCGSRHIGKSQTGYTKVNTDRLLIVKDMLDVVNAENETGIDTAGIGAFSTSTSIGPVFYKPVLQAISELAAALDGFDYYLNPIEYTAGKIGSFYGAAAIGTQALDAAFEFGYGLHNVQGYRRPVSNENLCNYGINLPPGFPDNATQAVQTYQDDSSIAARGRYEALISSDLVVDTFRQKLTQENVRLRKNPRQTISFSPKTDLGDGQVPLFGIDFSLGDVVPFHAKLDIDGELQTRINALMRVYKVEWDIGKQDEANLTVTVVTE